MGRLSDGEEEQPPSDRSGFAKELWRSGVWKLFPVLFLYITSIAVLIPFTPTIITDFLASKHSVDGQAVTCEGQSGASAPEACNRAHSDAVFLSSCSSFVSQSVLSFLLAPMVGSWSDSYGRKPFLLAGFFTALLPVSVVSLHLTFPGLISLYLYYPASAVNGAISSLSISLAFVADLLAPQHRAACFGLIMASFSVGILVGPVMSRYLTAMTASYVAMGGVAFCLAYVAVMLPESLSQQSRLEAQGRAIDAKQGVVARWSSMKILLRSTLFKRLTLCIMISGVVAEGLQDLLIQYLQEKLGFDTRDQGTLFIIYGVAGLGVQTLLLRLMLSCLSEARVLVLGMLAQLTQQVALAFVTTKTLAFAAIALGTLGSVTFPAISSIKANNVLDSEQGTVQGALYGARALAQGTGPFFFAAVFAAFSRDGSPLPHFPGACFLLGALLMVCAILVAMTLDGQSGQGLLAEHQDANPIPRARAAEDPWSDAEAQTAPWRQGILDGIQQRTLNSGAAFFPQAAPTLPGTHSIEPAWGVQRDMP
eukprot:jgi/Astpho2/6385/Aster-06047